MRYSLACAFLSLALAIGIPAMAASVQIAADRMAVVDGNRTFVLGLYECPGEDAVLDAVAAAGFNLVHVSESVEALDRLSQRGLFGWINTGGRIDLSAERPVREAGLTEMVNRFGAHPALFVWEVPDEALWNCWYGATQWRRGEEPRQLTDRIAALEDAALAAELKKQLAESGRLFERGDAAGSERLADAIWRRLGEDPPNPGLNLSNAPERAATMCEGMVQGYQFLKRIDPNHPVWMNHAPRNQIAQLAAFNQGADAVGCDIYPAPAYRGGHSDLADRSLASVGAYTARMQDAAPGKPVWMVLQGFGWADLEDNPSDEAREQGRRPTFSESRFMAYDAIVCGARGILYWGTYRIEKDSQLWTDLLKLIRELADLQPVLAAPDAALNLTMDYAETWGSLDRGVRVLAKNVDGAVWLLVVNEFHDPLNYTLGGLDAQEGMRYVDEVAERDATVTNGRLTLGIRSHGIQVLKPAEAAHP
ncbi:MAG TPA: hypothetical protein PLO37_07645 [Candidatus Hydrogenedentes bacterium]|nr:hypothetical protein [Candidatus Hydrogenedentota bacterium]HPG66704.1 hypothetical protein [Candidatus Hydrogenedentota bacterium]